MKTPPPPHEESIDVSPGGGLEFQNSGEKKWRKSTKRHARDFWRRYAERRTKWWRDIRRLAPDQNTEDARGEKRQQKLALPPRDACRPRKKCPARVPNCLNGRSCFLSVCCDEVNPTALEEQTGGYGPTPVLPSSHRTVSFFFISLCILNSQFFHQSLGSNWEMEVQLHPCCRWLGNFMRWTIAKILTNSAWSLHI